MKTMTKRIWAMMLAALLLVGLLGCTGKKEVEDFGMKSCVRCGNEYHATGDNTFINEDGGYTFQCPDCA